MELELFAASNSAAKREDSIAPESGSAEYEPAEYCSPGYESAEYKPTEYGSPRYSAPGFSGTFSGTFSAIVVRGSRGSTISRGSRDSRIKLFQGETDVKGSVAGFSIPSNAKSDTSIAGLSSQYSSTAWLTG